MARTGSYGPSSGGVQLGIFYTTTDNGMSFNVLIEILLKTSNDTLQDNSNDFYFDIGKSDATTYRGGSSINIVKNQELVLTTYSASYNKSTSAKTITCAAKLARIGDNDRTITVSNTFIVPALEQHTVSYNVNGGTGAPANQTKVYGTILTLSSVIPTKEGYKFKGWGTSSEDTTVDYTPGQQYGTDADITLYAIWEKSTDVKVKKYGKYVDGTMYVKKDGTYVRGTTYVKNNGSYKMGV